MKTIKTANGSIMRVSDEQARRMVDNIDYYYCPKDEYNTGKNISGQVTRINNNYKEVHHHD